MASYNRVILMGNLTRDPEVRYTPSGTAVCTLGLAVNRRFTSRSTGEQREEVCFVDVDVWDRQAQNCQQYLRKGDPAFIEGRLQMDQWEDRQTGQNRSRLKVVAENVRFLGAPRGGNFSEEPGGGSRSARPAGNQDRGQGGPSGGQGYRQNTNQMPPFPSRDNNSGQGGSFRQQQAPNADAFDVDDDEPIDDIPF